PAALCGLRSVSILSHSDHDSSSILTTRLELRAGDGRVIPAIYLRPAGKKNLPAMVAVHQHNGEFHLGKSEPAGLAGDPNMAYGMELAQLGCAVIIPDLACFEQRRANTLHQGDYAEYSFL